MTCAGHRPLYSELMKNSDEQEIKGRQPSSWGLLAANARSDPELIGLERRCKHDGGLSDVLLKDQQDPGPTAGG